MGYDQNMLVWYSKPVSLEHLLAEWSTLGANFDPDQPVDDRWRVQSAEKPLGPADDPRLFDAAVELLFGAALFPANLTQVHAAFLNERRPPRAGERIVQRSRLIPGVLDAVTLGIVSAVWHETDRRGFTMTSGARHYLEGEWTASITRRRGHDCALLMHSVHRRAPGSPTPASVLLSRVQARWTNEAPVEFARRLKAHARGVQS